MSQITQLADKIRAEESAKQKAESERNAAEAKRIIEQLEEEFKHTFPDLLPIIEAEGITWRGGMQNENYSHMGTFIEFHYEGRSLKMDFSNRGSYRFEFVPYQGGNNYPYYYGKSTFGKWPSSRFIVWLDENLVNSIIK